MGKSDIIASLKLNSTDYEQKLAKAKESTRKFSKDGGHGLEGMVGKFKGLAVAVAGSKAVMETFNAVIKSSQTIGDAYTQSVEGAKGAISEFVYAMANADFSGFNGGLRSIIGNAREAAAAMDALGNAQISYDYLTAGYRSSFKTNMATAKDKSLSKAERDAAYDAAMGSLSSMEMAVAGYTDKIVKAVVDNAVAKANNINRDYVTRENIDRIMELDLMPGGDEEKARLKAIYDQYRDIREQQMAYQREAKKYEDKLARGEHYTRNPLTGNMELNIYKAARLRRRRDEAQAEADRLNSMVATNAEYQQAALYNAMLVKGTDEWLQEMTSLIIKADNAKASLAEMKTSMYEVANQLNLPIKSGTVGAALTGEQYAQHFGVNYYNTLGNTLAGKAQQGYIPIQSVPIISGDIIEEPLPQVAAQAARVAEESYSAAEGIYAISDALGNLSGIMDDQTAKWFDWGVAMIGAIGQFVGALSTGNAGLAFSSGTSLLGGLVSIPSFGGEFKLRVQGSDLVGSINNYNKIKGRSY